MTLRPGMPDRPSMNNPALEDLNRRRAPFTGSVDPESGQMRVFPNPSSAPIAQISMAPVAPISNAPIVPTSTAPIV